MTRPDGGAPRVDGPDTWHRLSPGMMVVRPIELAPQLLPGLVGIVFAAQAAPVIALVVAIVLGPQAAADRDRAQRRTDDLRALVRT